MVKILKIIGRVLLVPLEWLLIFVVIFLFAIRTPSFQTYLARQATAFLSDELKSTVAVGGVDIVFFNRIYLDKVVVLDLAKDTLLAVGSIEANFDELTLSGKKIKLKNVVLNDGQVNVSKSLKTKQFNFQFMVDYFESDQPSSPSRPFELAVQKISIKNFALHYHDLTKRRTPKNFNENHMDITRLNLLLTEIKRNKQGLFLAINNLNLKESCGLNVKNLSGNLAVKSKSVVLSSVDIKLNQSQLKARQIGIRWNNAADFDQFEDKVLWRIDLQPSRILLRDVAYFVPEMNGMKDTIGIQGLATNTLSHLFLKGIKLDYATNTHIYADLELPNFNNLADYNFKEKIYSATLDMKEIANFNLPNPMGKLSLGEEIGHLGIVQLANVSVRGDQGDFEIGATTIKTSIGEASILQIIRLSNKSDFQIIPFYGNKKTLSFNDFDLRKFLSRDDLGIIGGDIGFSNFILRNEMPEIIGIDADFSKLTANNYCFKNVHITKANLYPDSFQGDISLQDPNVDLNYSGKIRFGKVPTVDVAIKINLLNLFKLNLGVSQALMVKGDFIIKGSGSNKNNLDGFLSCENLVVQDANKLVEIPAIEATFVQSNQNDQLSIKSSILDLDINGKIDPNTVVNHFIFEAAKIFPSIALDYKRSSSRTPNNFTYLLKSNNLNSILSTFVPGLSISNGSVMQGRFDSGEQVFELFINSDEVTYNEMSFKGVNISQKMSTIGIEANYAISSFVFSDSLAFNDLSLFVNGTNGLLNSRLVLDTNSSNNSVLEWQTTIANDNSLIFNLMPSYFSLNNIRWNITHSKGIQLTSKGMVFEDFLVKRNQQVISISGCLSENEKDKVSISLSKIDLDELCELLNLDLDVTGSFTGYGDVSSPFSSFIYSGAAEITNLSINKNQIGNISLQTAYDDVNKILELKKVDLLMNNNLMMSLSGAYFLKRGRDKLEMDLNLRNTDLKLLNGLFDPQIVNAFEGSVDGNIQILGNLDDPKLIGNLKLVNAGANFELLGVRYTLNGNIKVLKDEILFDNIPVKDPEGNKAFLAGQIYHNNFKKWNYDFRLNFNSDKSKNDSQTTFENTISNRFLVLNTAYKEGDVYYGKAYGKGYAHISGYGSKMDVDVFVETKSGSQINFPMFGVSDIDEEDQLVHFISKNKDDVVEVREKVDYTGLNLKMKFRLTPEAKLRIIFNEQLGDEINAFGSGDIGLKLDAFNNINMEGTCTIQKGSKYNFAMGPVKQAFDIKQGSKITWTGDVENAIIDLITAVNIKKVSLLDLRPDLGDKKLENQEVNCLLKLRGSLVEPAISFEIQAPNATETGRALVAEVNADTDELNRQFFSLLLVKKFQTSKGAVSASSTAALDLVESQINGLLGQLSKDYKVNVDLGETNALASVQKNFLNDRLLITGSFGVENSSAEGQTTSGFIGDVSVEYLVNKKGTLRVNAFNKSNTNTVDESSGPFTQGAGLSYHEEFNTLKDFELYQYTMDVFRPKDKKYFKNKRKKRQTRIPSLILDNGNIPALKKD